MSENPASIAGTVENGKRLPVVFGAYAGPAGIRERDDGVEDVAFFADRGAALPEVGSSGSIDGRAVKVIGAARSDTARGMIVLKVVAP